LDTPRPSRRYITFVLLLNNFIPISLYVSMEIAKTIQGLQMNWDIEMYHPETDTPALTRTTNLNEELGQIQYIFSDKTGTLTQNVMEFRKCFIAGVSYGFGTTEIGLAAAARGANIGQADPSQAEAENSADPDKAQFYRDRALAFDDCRLLQRYQDKHAARDKIEAFMRVLSVSHTVVPEGDCNDPAKLVYQAESPDEGALTLFAKAIGWCFCAKTSTHTTVKVHDKDEVYEVLNINKFNSARKRMSVVARNPEGKLVLYCKGADNVMLERIKPGQEEAEQMKTQLGLYATEGLRTLVLATKELTEEEWKAWNEVHHAATTALEDREGALERAAEEIEKDMIIAGATAIEDKLQDGVPDAIATLAQGGVKIWVLTGDKQETAENIGFACRLLHDDMSINYINGANDAEIKAQLADALTRNAQFVGKENEHLALLVDGKSLLTIMAEKELTADLLKFATMCKAVIACRVSPSQKMQIVAMVRKGVKPEPMTLSIGDGANDVPMILEAHVGVGISGNEGMQAVRSADFAIAQFRYLKRLMLFHGRNNYRRVATLLHYCLYKNIMIVSCLAMYNFVNGWSGTLIMDSWVFSMNNVLYTFFFIIFYAFMEQDVSDKTALTHPQLYIPGQRHEGFNKFTMAVWVANALVQATIVYGIPTLTFAGWDDSDQQVYGVTVMCAAVLTANMRIVFIESHISWISHTVATLCISLFFLFIILYSFALTMGLSFWNFSGVGIKALVRAPPTLLRCPGALCRTAHAALRADSRGRLRRARHSSGSWRC
jgi:phospholipid-transporting ATPase